MVLSVDLKEIKEKIKGEDAEKETDSGEKSKAFSEKKLLIWTKNINDSNGLSN